MKTKIHIIVINEKDKETTYQFRNSAKEAEECAKDYFNTMKIHAKLYAEQNEDDLIGKNPGNDLTIKSFWQMKDGIGNAQIILAGSTYASISIFEHEISIPNKFEVQTSEGEFQVSEEPDRDCPGIWIYFEKYDCENDPLIPLAHIGYYKAESGRDSGEIVSKIWCKDPDNGMPFTSVVHDINFLADKE